MKDDLRVLFHSLKINKAMCHQFKCGKGRDHDRGRERNSNHGDHLAPNNRFHHHKCRKDVKHEVVQNNI